MNNIKKILLNEANSNSELFLSLKADFSYHSSAIEGSKVTEKDNKEISKISSMISAETIATKYHDKYTHDEVIENFNCGILFEYIFKTFDEPITEKSIKIWHNILKKDTEWSQNYLSSYGDYKKLPNEIDSKKTPQPWEISSLMSKLINMLDNAKNIHDIVKVHAEFETIHPFLDGNGRIGRAIMFKQCLQNNLFPIIINNVSKRFYYDSLKHYQSTGKIDLLESFVKEQQKFFEKKYQKYLNSKK